MEIKKATNNSKLILTLKGRLDTITSPQLETEVSDDNLENITSVIMDFNNLEYISSAGLRILLTVYKKMSAKDGELKIINVNDAIMDLFNMTKLTDYLTIE